MAIERAFVTEAAFSIDDAVFPGVVTAQYTGNDGDFEINVDALGCGRLVSCTLDRADIEAVRGWLGIGGKVEDTTANGEQRMGEGEANRLYFEHLGRLMDFADGLMDYAPEAENPWLDEGDIDAQLYDSDVHKLSAAADAAAYLADRIRRCLTGGNNGTQSDS